MNIYKAFNVQAMGYSHTQTGLPLQDSSYSVSNEKYAMAVISDGHGSIQYLRSDRGSRIAADVSSRLLADLIEKDRDVYKNTENLKSFIKRDWMQAVAEDYSNEPFSEVELDRLREGISTAKDSKDAAKRQKYLDKYMQGTDVHKAYGCTLIAVAACDKYIVGVHIGDGTCVAFYEDGTFDQPVPEDPNNMANIAGSLCNSDTGCRVYVFEKRPIAVFAASDGIDDSYGTGQGLYNFYLRVMMCIAENQDGFAELLQNDLPEISRRGSKDDMSIAAIYDYDAILQYADIIKKLLECGREKLELARLEDDNGGISLYGLSAREDRVRRETEKKNSLEGSRNVIVKTIDGIRSFLASLRNRFDYSDSEAVQRFRDENKEKCRQLRDKLEAGMKTNELLRQKLSSNTAELDSIRRELAKAEKEAEVFENEFENFKRQSAELEQCDAERRKAETESTDVDAKLAEAEREYQSAKEIYDNAQKRKAELQGLIAEHDKEIADDIAALRGNNAPAETPAETPAAPAETPAAPSETPSVSSEIPAAPSEIQPAAAETQAAPAEEQTVKGADVSQQENKPAGPVLGNSYPSYPNSGIPYSGKVIKKETISYSGMPQAGAVYMYGTPAQTAAPAQTADVSAYDSAEQSLEISRMCEENIKNNG